MSEALPFPPQEAAPSFVELNDLLKEQIRLYGTPTDMQSYVDNCLETIHGKSSLGYVLDVSADGLALYYARAEGRSREKDSFKRMFYAGSLLATDVAMTNLPDGVSDRFHHFSQAEIESEYADDSEGKARAYQKINELIEIHQIGIEDNDKAAIEAAAYLYAPNADPDMQEFFSLGYRFGSMTACTLAEYYYPEIDETAS